MMKKKTESPMYKYIISQITFKYVYGNIMRCQFHLSSAATTGDPQKKYFQKIIFVILGEEKEKCDVSKAIFFQENIFPLLLYFTFLCSYYS